MQERLGFLHYVAVACIAITALFEALQQALKDSPGIRAALQIDLSGAWNYLPLILLSAGAGAWAGQQLFRPSRHTVETINLLQKATSDLVKSRAERRAPPASEPDVDRHPPPASPPPPPPPPPSLLWPSAFDADTVPEAVSRRYLELKVRPHTEIQETNTLNPYEGKYMVLEAELFNVHPVKGGVQAQVYGAQNEKRSSVMFVVFKDEWRMQLEQAPPGSKLSFKAKIRVTHSGQHFWEADLLRLDLPADDRPGA